MKTKQNKTKQKTKQKNPPNLNKLENLKRKTEKKVRNWSVRWQ